MILASLLFSLLWGIVVRRMDNGLVEHLAEPAMNRCLQSMGFMHLWNPINIWQIEFVLIWIYSKGSENRFVVVQYFWYRKICKILCRVPRQRVKSKFLYQDANVILLADKCIVVRSLSAGYMTKFSWRRESSLTTSGSQKMDSCLVLTERLIRRILRLRTSAIDSTHSERVSTSGATKMRQVPCISGPYAKHLSVFGYGRYWDHLSLYGLMEPIEIQNHGRNKVWVSGRDHRSLFAADLLCNWKFWKQPNGYGYKKCMATSCIENMEGFYFGQIADSTCCLNPKRQCLYWQIWLSEKGGSLFWRFTYPDSFEKSVGGNIQNDILKSMLRRYNVSKM